MPGPGSAATPDAASPQAGRPSRFRGDDRRPVDGALPRLFVAVPVPDDVAAAVGGVIAETRAGLGVDARAIRWVQTTGLHLTLRFLGPTPKQRIPVIAAALDRAAAATPAFEVRLAGAGAFPDAGRPRALWIGIRIGADGLGGLAARVEQELVAEGWVIDPRAYRPHVTVARTDGVRVGVVAATILAEASRALDAGFRADRVVLYRSHLGSGPGRYERLHEAVLA